MSVLKTEGLPQGHMAGISLAGSKFNNVLRFSTILFWIGLRRQALLDMRYFFVRTNPDNIQRVVHVLHPEAAVLIIAKNKQHAGIFGQAFGAA